MRRNLFGGLLVVAIGAGVAWIVTSPTSANVSNFENVEPDMERGEYVYTAAGCASCHAGAEGDGEVLEGGMAFPTEFGTFYAPNISPSETGIGAWTVTDLAGALQHGTGINGEHLYPALPYVSYSKIEDQDVVHLHAYLMTLPESATENIPHDVSFPFNIRRLLGGWKLINSVDGWIVDDPNLTELELQGRYLVEALGHCGECHTPRNALGGLDTDRWLAGADNPNGDGNIPNITTAALDWSESDIAYYLESGFTPDFDSAGGHMAHVVENFATLGAQDREAVAAYLKRVPPAE